MCTHISTTICEGFRKKCQFSNSGTKVLEIMWGYKSGSKSYGEKMELVKCYLSNKINLFLIV